MASPETRSPRLTGLLDIGTSKVVCLAVATPNAARPRLVGWGLRPSYGVKAGEIADPIAAATALVSAIAEAERSAGAELDHLVLAAAGGRMAVRTLTAEALLDPTIVQASDLAMAEQHLRSTGEHGGRVVLECGPRRFKLDGAGVREPPLDRFGRRLAVDADLVTQDAATLRRVVQVVASTNLPIRRIVPAGPAAARAVTTTAERQAGIAVLDIGAGAATITVFARGHVAAVHGLAMGGNVLTGDVARHLGGHVAEAERIKILYGNVSVAHAGEPDAAWHRISSDPSTDLRSSPPAATSDNDATRAGLRLVLTPRIDVLLRHAADRLDAIAYAGDGIGRVVLTGGGSQLAGLPAYAAHMLGRPVRLGAPHAGPGFEAIASPANAVAVGLVEALGRASSGAAYDEGLVEQLRNAA